MKNRKTIIRLASLVLSVAFLLSMLVICIVPASAAEDNTAVDFTKWETSLGKWDYTMSGKMDDLADGFDFRYTIKLPAGNRNVMINFLVPNSGIDNLNKGPYYQVQYVVSSDEAFLKLWNITDTGKTPETATAEGQIPEAYNNTDACEIPMRLVVNKNDIKYYMGDMENPVITATMDSPYMGGFLCFQSRRPEEGIEYTNGSLVYLTGTSGGNNNGGSTTEEKTEVVDFTKWEASLGKWDYTMSDKMDDLAYGFDFRYTIKLPAGNRNVMINFLVPNSGIDNLNKGSYYQVQYTVGSDTFLKLWNIVDNKTPETATAEGQIPEAYNNTDACEIPMRLVVDKTDVKYYMGDMETPVITATMDSPYMGGSLCLQSRRPEEGIEYTDGSLTYFYEKATDDSDNKEEATTGVDFTKWTVQEGSWDYVMSDVMDDLAYGYDFRYTMTLPKSNRNINLNFGVPNTGVDNLNKGPYYQIQYVVSSTESYIKLASVNASGVADQVIAEGTLPTAYTSPDACEIPIRLVIDKTDIKYYMGDMETPLITATGAYAYSGGCICFMSKRPEGIVYSDGSLTYFYEKSDDEDSNKPSTPVAPEISDELALKNLTEMQDLSTWEDLSTEGSSVREYLAPAFVEGNFVLDVDVSYLTGDGLQYEFVFGLQDLRSANRVQGPFYRVVIKDNGIFLYSRNEANSDQRLNIWALPEGLDLAGAFHVKLYVNGNYMAMYFDDAKTPACEAVLDPAFTNGGLLIKTSDTFAFFENLTVQSYVAKSSIKDEENTGNESDEDDTQTDGSGAGDADDDTQTDTEDEEKTESPLTGVSLPWIGVALVIVALFAVAVTSKKRACTDK